MSFRNALIFLVLLAVSCQSEKKQPVLSVQSLAGTWKSTGNLVFYEEWTLQPDSSLLGKGYSINGSDTLVLEQLRIAKIKDTLTYFATVIKQNKGREVAFKCVESEIHRWVFENNRHDYPNRIIYQLDADTLLFARTENKRGNKPVEFHFKRLK